MQADAVTHAFERHRGRVWGVCYRMTGSASDADDLVQETFRRALERPPADTERSLAPWLVKVAVNLSRDLLRRRRRRGYPGPWLPAPVDDDAGLVEEAAARALSQEARYSLAESATLAFLLALEALTPQQRAVLLLRDVLDYSVREVADALELTEGNVKVTHHRARRRMEGYDVERELLSRDAGRHALALERFVSALLSQDHERLAALLAEDVTALSDGGGERSAARRPVTGRDAVARLYLGLMRLGASGQEAALRGMRVASLNGLPALVVDLSPPGPSFASRVVLQVRVDEAGLVRAVHAVLAPSKLSHVMAPEHAAKPG